MYYDRMLHKDGLGEIGLGASFTSMSSGNFIFNEFQTMVGPRIKIGDNRFVTIGIGMGMRAAKLNFEDFVTIDPNDPAIPTEGVSTKFNMNIGIGFKSKHWQFGVSSTNVTQSEFAGLNIQTSRQYYISASYELAMKDFLKISPSVRFITDMNMQTTDVNMLLTLKDQLWMGVNYNTNENMAFMAGFDLAKKYRVGYCYETSSNTELFGNNHEFVVGYVVQ